MAAGLKTVLLFLLFITQAWAQQSPSSTVNGTVHGVVYLSPSVQNQTSYPRMHWRHNDLTKIAIREGGQHVEYPSNIYKGRLELFSNNTLKISNLQKSDSGRYYVYLEDEKGNEHIENILLKVYDLVPKPTVSAKVVKKDLQGCKTILKCSVEVEDVTYEWISPQKLLLEHVHASELSVSSPLTGTYTCKVSNPVSSNSALLLYKQPCSWTGESSAAASCATTSVLVALGHLLLLFFLCC
ncbi:CD48 antigen-like [Pelecanus crispus]|uniref:CD48 antigen-like n=1 Tax=Pelecanus crispus TaxID=36300 RepID=UPI003F5D3EB1